MNLKNIIYLRKTKWYHATTLKSFNNICQHGIIADINKEKELDFGSGLYLSSNRKWSVQYAESFINTINCTDYGLNEDEAEMVIIEFEFKPISFIKSGYKCLAWNKQNRKYAEFVYKCRMYPNSDKSSYDEDMVVGPMTDGNQIEAIQQYKNDQISKDQLLKIFMENTGDWQLLLHSQQICDMIKPVSATTLKGVDLDVTNYKKEKTCKKNP